ncbi:MAG: serine/threonine protein kinase, partial [Nostoc sp.]|uniref:WD40 repeat domain-containing protein n=1 Tax=Nostoc sp. TaxID=1180 RepID=UPI0030294D4D
TLQAHSDSICSIAFSPDGKILASGSYDKTIKLWNVGTAREIYTLKGHSSYVNSVAFSPDDKILASGSYDKTINIWQLASLSNTATSSSVQHTQSQVSQSSIGMVVLWWFFVIWSILLCFTSVVSGFVGGFLMGAIGIGCCWGFYRWFWRF